MAQATRRHSAIRAVTPDSSACSPTGILYAAHAELIATVSGQAPYPTPINAGEIDIENSADALNELLDATSVYLTAVLDDLAQNVPGSLDIRQINALVADLKSEVGGTFQHAIEQIVGRRA